MEQFQAVFVALSGKRRSDEETVTDLLNERARAGWRYRSATALGTRRLVVVFVRET